MSAERLREAARMLRERAADGDYSIDPDLGLALADWLEMVGAWIDEGLGLIPPDINIGDAWADVEGQAYRLADLILGGASSSCERTGPMSAAHIDADPSRRPAIEKCSSCGHRCGYHFTLDGRTIPCDADVPSPVRDCGCEQYTHLAENDADLILGDAP